MVTVMLTMALGEYEFDTFDLDILINCYYCLLNVMKSLDATGTLGDFLECKNTTNNESQKWGVVPKGRILWLNFCDKTINLIIWQKPVRKRNLQRFYEIDADQQNPF